jgi:ribonuclease HII
LVRRQTKKKLLIGVDEAGYGPNLGPLLIGGSAWLVPRDLGEIEFFQLLANSFHTSAWCPACQHVPLGDSKKLYQAGSGLRSLEIGLLTMLSTMGQSANNLESMLRLVSTDQLGVPGNPPWYHAISAVNVPSDTSFLAEIDRLRQVALEKLDQHDIELVACRATILTEPDFNQRVSQCDSKGRVLSLATLDLVSQLLQSNGYEQAEIYCDRQGGRKNYLPLLLEWQPDSWFVETAQSSTRCSYRTTASPQLEIHFTVGGDSFPPTALASMIAKYLRERLMEAFNEYWAEQCPGLKPTAGYPQDAQRFRQAIEPIAQQNSLATETWWRFK